MSVYHRDRAPQGDRLSESPRQTLRRPWRQRRATSHRPRLELLEERVVLSPTIFTVNSTGNGTSGSGTSGTLPYVISQANANANTDGSEIEFDSSVFNSSSPQTITLGATLMLSETAGPEVIEGPGTGIVAVSGKGATGVFNIAPGTVVSMSGLSIINGYGTFGGGLYNEGMLTITNTIFYGNQGQHGGALYTRAGGSDPHDGFVTLTDDAFSNNTAGSEGGAIDNWAGGTVTVTDDTFTGNYAPDGGAIGNEWGTVAVSNSTFSNNTSSGAGGAIINYNPSDDFSNSLSIVDSTISGSVALNGGDGGGIANGGPDTLSLTNDTITRNSATGSGGGLYNDGTTALSDCTISGNSADNSGGGLANQGGTATIGNTIVAQNTATTSGPDVFGTFASQGHNLIGETDGSSGWAGSDLTGTIAQPLDPLLAPLNYYGGPTETMVLLLDSPAIDAGNVALIPAGITTDQRGYARTVNGTVDIGAYEAQSIPLVVNSAADGIGCPRGELDLRGAVNLANLSSTAATISFDPTVFSTAQTITLSEGTLILSNTAAPEVIDGPGAGVLAVSGDDTSEVFSAVSFDNLTEVFEIATGTVVSMSGLSIIDGYGSVGFGGGLWNLGTLTITNTTFTGNTASLGGAIFNGGGGLLTLTGDAFSSNSADTGGAIYNTQAGNVTVTDDTFTGNSAEDGGAIYSDHGSVAVSNSTFSNNTASIGAGGAIINFYVSDALVSSLSVVDSTFSGNAAVNGGGIANEGPATLTLTDSTISGNSATQNGGGLYNVNGTRYASRAVSVGNTIVAGNTAGGTGADAFGSFASQGNNLIGESDGSSGWIASDLTGTIAQPLDPLLAPLAYYGGPTETMALLPGSPAIAAGNTALIPPGVTTDQRGYPRIVNGTVDIGAYEVQSIPLVVNTTADGGGCPPGILDLRGAVDLADILPGAQTITFDPTVFATPQTITLTSGQLELSNTSGLQTITGPPAGVTISGDGQSRVFEIDAGVTASISGLTISEGSTTGNGGGLYDDGGTVTLTDVTVSGSSAAAGGGLCSSKRGTITITGCTVTGNTAGSGGGMYNYGGTINLTDCTVSGNSATTGGGGLCNTKRGTITITGCTVTANSAAAGGGLYNDQSTANLNACTIAGNSAAVGGGIDNVDDDGATLEDTIVATNTGTGGSPSDIGGSGSAGVVGTYDLVGTGGAGGIAGGAGDIVLTNLNSLMLAPLGNYGGPTETMPLLPGSAGVGSGTTIPGVSTDQRGLPVGATPDIGSFQIQTGLVVNTTIDGTISPSGDLTLRQAVNLANAQGGAETISFDPTVFASAQTITLTLGQLELSDTSGTETIKGPAAGVTVSGGGTSRVFQVDSGVTATLTGLTISGGSTAGNGGGLYNKGTTTLTNCTVSGNSAGGAGGGLCDDGTTTLTNCTVSGNSASTGGGLASVSGTTTLTDCTVSGNSAATGGGLYFGRTATLQDTIVAGNTGNGGSTSDIGGDVNNASSYNLIGTGGSGGLDNGANHNIVVTSLAGLGLAKLGDYGGPTETMALLPGSAAIGAGTAVSGITTDQRGAPRPTSGATDIGAFESSGFTITVTSGSGQTTGVLTAFSAPLDVTVTANNPDEPVAGGLVTFTPPPNGASATVSGSPAIIGATGTASATATANATAGTYAVTASATGVTSSASFNLTNQIQPSFSGLIAQTITYGSSVTLAGTLAAGSQVPVGEDVAVTLGGVTNDAKIAANGSFSTEFTPADVVLNVTSNAYTVTYDYATDGTLLSADGSSQLTITPAPLTITATSDAKVYDGTVTSSQIPTHGTLYNGDTVTGLTQAFTSANVLGADGSTLAVTGYTVNDGDGGKDYTVTTQTATGTITPAPLTVQANNVSTGYGAKLPALTYTITGFVNGESASVVSGAPVITTTAGSSANVGAYPITVAAGTLSAANYNFPAADLIAGTLTVTPAPLVIKAISDTKVYDGTITSSQIPTYGTLYNGNTVTGLTQAFTSANVLGANGSTLSVTGYTVNDGDGGKDYAVTTQTATGTIMPAPLTITATSDTKVYDGTATSSKTPTYGTLYNGDTVTGLTQAFSSKNVLGTNGSTLTVTGYTVNDGDGGKDYMVTLQTATGTITPAPLTVQANNVSTVYGSNLPALSYTITGFVGGDNSSVVSGAPLIATTATSSANAGAYAITIAAGTLSAANYNFPAADLIAGTLTVTPAPLVIAAVSTKMFTGQPVPALKVVYTGFVNGDTPASLTKPPVLHSAASPSSEPGRYPITVGDASSPNYMITYMPGTLTVILAPATVEKVSVQTIKVSTHKSVPGIVVQFSEALDSADAQNINSYTLATVPSNKKKSKPVQISAAMYSSSAFTVTLLTSKSLVLNPPLLLTVKAASLLDALGRELDGNDSGRSGANFTAVLSKAGTSVTSARELARIGGLSPDAVDAVLKTAARGGR